ncbi:MAG: DUF4443 domain-containing protein [Nanoarchaeota archaeon]
MAGAIAHYTDLDILHCFLLVGRCRSRAALSSALGLGEGITRSVLDVLKRRKLLATTKEGHALTAKGRKALTQLSARFSSPVPIKVAGIHGEQAAVIVKKPKSCSVVEARDEAVRAGAKGALLFFFDGKLHLPPLKASGRYQGLAGQFPLRKGQMLVVSFSGERRLAENGALAMALMLSGTKGFP